MNVLIQQKQNVNHGNWSRYHKTKSQIESLPFGHDFQSNLITESNQPFVLQFFSATCLSSTIGKNWKPFKLKNNTIKQVDDFSFMNWMNLQTLDMQYNQLSKPNAISKQAFKPLKRLKVRIMFYYNFETQII